MNRGHNWAADHFSLGAMIYEMIWGETPFYKDGMEQMELFRAIVKCDYRLPSRGGSNEVASIIQGFLSRTPNKRLGSLKGGEDDIYNHPWFANVDFDDLRLKKIKAPRVPKFKDPLDTSCFEDWSHLADKGKKKYPKISAQQEALFECF